MLITGRQGLALMRIVLGALLLVSGVDKLGKGWLSNGEAMTQTIQQNLPRSEAFYRPFLEGTVLPNAALFSQLVTVGELVAGASLLLGLFTRVGAIVCMWLMLNYMLMKGTLLNQYMNGMTYSDRVYFIGGLACFLAAAGLAWGLDRLIGPRLAHIPVMRWLIGYPIRRSDIPPVPVSGVEPIPMRRRDVERTAPPTRRVA